MSESKSEREFSTCRNTKHGRVLKGQLYAKTRSSPRVDVPDKILSCAANRLGSSLGEYSWSRSVSSATRSTPTIMVEGTSALLLPAPLIAVGSRWANPAAIRPALAGILQVVTAFTIGHSITLALAAIVLVRVPARPVGDIDCPFHSPFQRHTRCVLFFPARNRGWRDFLD